tara:strand:+ start:1462 stop:1671 length:210 start_codon:yes stop_codon:yes gene_type:complete
MDTNKQNPVALAGAHRAENIVVLGSNFDRRNSTPINAETLSVSIMSRRINGPLSTVQLIGELAGIGGAP